MAFPVDILATVDPEFLEQSAKDYMSKLLYRNSEIQESLSIPGSDRIEVGLCNVSFVPLYGVDIKQKVLALFSPEEPFKAVGLYLLDQWWSAEDILKTADSSRTGLIKVRTPGERIVLYVLNRIMYRTKEIAGDDVPFLCHGEDEIAKILWKNGEAVGFYSVKPEGKLCNDFLTQRYQLPVMDTIFIRKCHRGNGHGLQFLKDFVDSFRKEVLGLKYPLSPAMYKVCKKYLSLYPEDTELLWEVDGVGSPFQRTLIARKLKAMDLKGNRQVVGKLNFDTEDSDVPMEVGVTQVQETMEYTEVIEEVVQIKITEEVKNTPFTTRGRSSSLKRQKLGAGTEETAEKIIRVKDTGSDVQCAGDELACKDSTLSLNLKECELKDTIETMTCDVTPILEITHLHCEAQNKLTREPIYQSETGRVADINPVMEIESLKQIEDAQILQTFKATIAPVDLQPLERQQEVTVEIVKMSSETEEVKEKAVEIRVFKDGVNREKPSDGTKHSGEIVKTQKDRTDMAETFNKESTEDGEGMGKRSVIENIIEDTEEIEVVKVHARALKEKEQHECFSVHCETEDQEPSHDNKEEKVSILIQQEETLNIAYGSGSKGKQGDERKSWHSRRLEDKAAKGEQTERVLRSSSKKTFKATSKQVDDETIEKGLNQTEFQAALTEEEQVEEIAENDDVRGKIKSTSIMCIASNDNKEEINIEKDYLDHQTTDDQNIMEVENKREDSSKDENKMDEKLRDEEQKQVKAGVIEVAMTSEDGEEIVDVSSTDKSEKSGKAPESSAAEHIEEQEEEPALKRVPAEDDVNTQVTLKQQRVALTLGAPTEKQQVVEMADHENVDIFRDRIKNRTIEVTVVRLDKTEIKETTDTNKMEEAEEEEPMNEPATIQSVEPKITNIEASLDYEVDKTNKDDKKTAAFGVHGADDVNAAGIEVKGKVPEPSFAEPFKEQEAEPISEMVPAEIAQKAKKANSTWKLQKVAVVLVDSNKVFTMHTDASEDAGRTSQPESTDDVENKEADGLYQKVETTEKEQEVEIMKKGNVTVEVMDKIQNSSIEKPEEMMETEERVIITDVDSVSELTADKNKMEDQEEKAVTETTVVQDTPEEEIKSKEIIESDEDGGGVKLDDQIELSKEEKDKTNSVTLLRHSRRLKHHTAESELTERVLRSVTKVISQQEKMKQPVDPEVEQMKEVGTEYQNPMEVGNKIEDSSHDKNKVDSKLRNEEEKTTKDFEKIVVIVHNTEDIRGVEIRVEGSPEPSAAEPVACEEQWEEPVSEAAEDDNTEDTSLLKLQNVAVVLVDYNKVLPKQSPSESEDSKMDKEPSQPQEEEVQELHKPESIDHKNEGKEGVNQTECEAELSEIEQEVTEDKHEETETDKLRDEKMDIEEKMSEVEDKFSESDEKKMNEAQEEEVMQPLCTNQDILGEEPIIQDDVESGEDDEGLKSDAEEEEDKTTFGTPLRRSKRRKHQLAESELTKSVPRSTAKAMKQPVDDPEVEQMKEVPESHTETSVEEKFESVGVTSETGHFKAVEVGFKDKIAGQSAAETVNEHQEESSAITGPAGDDNTKEAMSGLRLEKVTVVLVDKISTAHIDAVEVMETSQSQEKVDLELHKPESTDTESQTEHTDNGQVVKMRENEMKETDGKVESQEGAVLNNGNVAPESAVTDKQNIEEVQNDTLTAQEIQAEEPRSLHVIESSEEDKDERPDVIIKLGKDEEDEASSLTPLRRSRRLQDQAAESALTKRVLRRSARLTNKSTPQQRHKQQIKAMMMTEPKQLDEYKSDEMNILVESEVAVGEHMESETINVFAEVDPGSMISAVQSTSEEKSEKEKEGDDDHTNVKNVSISHGNEVEKNISSENDTEKEKMAPKKIIHGEAEQICTSGEKSPVDMELSEAVKEVEDEVKEKARGEDENVMEATSALALQEASVVLVDVKKLPLDHVDLHNTDVVKDNISVEEQKEELAMEVAAEEDRDNGVNSTSSLKVHKAAVVLVDFQIQTGVNETERNEVTQLQEVALPTRANQEKILVEIGVKEPVTERKEKEEEAVEPVTDHRLIRNDEQNRNVVAEIGVSDYLKEGVDILIEKSASTELDINKTVNEYQQGTTASQGDNVQESTRDEDIPVCAANNPRRRTLPVKPTPERKSRHLQNTYEETKVNKNAEEDSSDEEVETVLTRHLRWRTVTVTPRRRLKPLTGKHVAESVMEAHESKVCHDIVEVQGTEEARNVVEETHETNSKCDIEEVSAVSKAATKDQQQNKNIPESKAGKVEKRTDKGGKMVKEAADRKDQDYVEGHLQDENEEIKDTDEPNREQVRSANTKQDNAQEETFEKRKHLEEGKNKHTMNILITEAVLDESEEGVGVERKALRKRTITSQAASVQKSKRLRKQDQGDIDVQRANTEEPAPVEATVKDMADVQSQTEKETTDQEKETLGREMCHKKKNQENAEGEETSGNANNSQENTVIEGMSKQVWLSEMLNVSEEDTDIKLVAQEKAKGKEDRKKELVTEEVTEFENNAGKPDKVADEPKEFKDTQEYKDTQEEAEQSEKNAEGMTKANVTIDEYFTSGLDDEINSDDAECNQVVGETKRILRSRKSVTASTSQQKSARRSRRQQQDGPMEPSETEDKSEAEEVKQVIGEEEKKLQQKRKVVNVDEELTPRRSKRLARAKIM